MDPIVHNFEYDERNQMSLQDELKALRSLHAGEQATTKLSLDNDSSEKVSEQASKELDSTSKQKE